ncbi:MAG TPA: prepilin-type N-terminal cleavage/methylation domain-containing protein [Allosphingosinicella sp.]|nr:prepilin-type N-terminal cleavage/methylation domain-containing protein [Allosphingosinicella sp.]
MTTLSNPTSKRRRAAFTLIELLVVVLILGILLAVAIPLYLSSVKNSATQTVKGNLRTVGQAVQAYKVRNNAYPTAMSDVVGPDKEIQALPVGPRTVAYSLSGSTVYAGEGPEDTFGSSTPGEMASFDVSTGQYSANL